MFRHFTHLKHAQNYNPLYEQLFDITPSNFNTIQLNHKFRLKKLLAKDNDCVFKAIVFNHKNNQTKTVPVFFKYSPLLDPVKYMIGKYQDNDVTIPDFTLKQDSKIYQSNNYDKSMIKKMMFTHEQLDFVPKGIKLCLVNIRNSKV